MRKPGVAPNAAHQVEFTLPVTAQVDRSGGDVDVHEIVHGPALGVVLDLVHQVSAAHIEDFDVRQVPAPPENMMKISKNPLDCSEMLMF